MATIGNLELRLHQETLYHSTTHDGDSVYNIFVELSNFLDCNAEPTEQDYKNWFRQTAKKVLPFRYREELTGGVPHEIIIDPKRKLIIHNGSRLDLSEIVTYHIRKLKKEHNYQIIHFKRGVL